MPRGVYPRPPSRAKKLVIRRLQPEEPRPQGEPRRYFDRAGYVRLRWKVGVREYVEIREHRFVVGAGDDYHVHHLDHQPGNNDRSNLVILTPEEHSRYHSQLFAKFDLVEARALYEAGWSTPRLGAHFGVAASCIYRRLKRAGVPLRSVSDSLKYDLDLNRIRELHGQGVRAERIAKLLGLRSSEAVRRAMKEMGLPSFSPGRPPVGDRGEVA